MILEARAQEANKALETYLDTFDDDNKREAILGPLVDAYIKMHDYKDRAQLLWSIRAKEEWRDVFVELPIDWSPVLYEYIQGWLYYVVPTPQP